jgi:hypothetical protein
VTGRNELRGRRLACAYIVDRLLRAKGVQRSDRTHED